MVGIIWTLPAFDVDSVRRRTKIIGEGVELWVSGSHLKGDAMKSSIVPVLAFCLVLAGCCGQSEQPASVEQPDVVADWIRVTPTEMTETQKAQQELCVAAVNTMASEMLGEIEAALETGDPAKGIAVCRELTPSIAAHISEQFGIKIGRTAFYLRNPDSTPPEWAKELVLARANEPAFLVGPQGEFGALLPIRLKAECQMCHGPAELIDPDIQAAIAEHYPADQGVDFAEGSLRGWFWAVTPPGEPEPSS
jgi:Protein of unknown function (DUF3365)